VLYLGGYRDEERQRLSDATCTALQLANFWQDVAVDLEKNRVYLPQDLLARHGYSRTISSRASFTPAFHLVMEEAVEKAQGLFEQGLPLARMLDRRLALDIDLFSRGGMRVLDKIRAQDYNVLKRAPRHLQAGTRLAAAAQPCARHPRGMITPLKLRPLRGHRPPARPQFLLLLPPAAPP
jgi:phytoene/squalene synthetase